MQPEQQHGKDKSHKQTEGQLKPHPTPHPPTLSHPNLAWKRHRAHGIEKGRCFAASPQVRGERVPALKQQSAPNNPGGMGCKAEFAQSFPGKSCKAGLSLLRKQQLCCFALCSTVPAVRQVVAFAEEPSQPREEGNDTTSAPSKERQPYPRGIAHDQMPKMPCQHPRSKDKGVRQMPPSLPLKKMCFLHQVFFQVNLTWSISSTGRLYPPGTAKAAGFYVFPFSNFMASCFPAHCRPALPAQGWITRTGRSARSQPAERAQALQLWEATA